LNVADVTLEAFEPYVEQTFRVSGAGDVAFEAELIEASPMGRTVGPNGRRAFSLVLRGPETSTPLQQVYRVEHEAVGTLDLFLVPIGPDAEGMRYEAVFT
jgi:hypothetical protein